MKASKNILDFVLVLTLNFIFFIGSFILISMPGAIRILSLITFLIGGHLNNKLFEIYYLKIKKDNPKNFFLHQIEEETVKSYYDLVSEKGLDYTQKIKKQLNIK